MNFVAKLAIFSDAVLACACDHHTWRLDVRVTVPPDVQASYADSLPAAVLISGTKPDEHGAAAGSAFVTRRIGLVCEPNTTAISFHAAIKDSGCGVETRVQAWLLSEAGFRDLLERRFPIAGTDHVTEIRDASAPPLSKDAICSALEPLEMIFNPSAAPSAASPQAEAIAFSGQHSSDCDRETDSVSLVVATPDE